MQQESPLVADVTARAIIVDDFHSLNFALDYSTVISNFSSERLCGRIHSQSITQSIHYASYHGHKQWSKLQWPQRQANSIQSPLSTLSKKRKE
jgi:hypothetical protein